MLVCTLGGDFGTFVVGEKRAEKVHFRDESKHSKIFQLFFIMNLLFFSFKNIHFHGRFHCKYKRNIGTSRGKEEKKITKRTRFEEEISVTRSLFRNGS